MKPLQVVPPKKALRARLNNPTPCHGIKEVAMKTKSLFLLLMGMLLLQACLAPTPGAAPTTAPSTPTAFPATPPPLTMTAPPPTLRVCLGAEPEALDGYTDPDWTARLVGALLRTPVAHAQAQSLAAPWLVKLPRLGEGDAVLQDVSVHEGDRIINAQGQVTVLRQGEKIRPSGCGSATCEIEYKGEALRLPQMTVTYTLRSDWRWSDGTPLTANDAQSGYTLARYWLAQGDRYRAAAGLAHPDALLVVEGTARYEALDATTLRWQGVPGLLTPYYQLNLFLPLPTHQLPGQDPAAWVNSPALRAPLSWGPYRLEAWTPERGMTLARNSYSQETPSFERIEIRFVGQDVQRALKDDTCDVITSDALLERPATWPEGWTLYTYGAPWGEQLAFRADLQPVVKQAVALCVERTALARTLSAEALRLDNLVASPHPFLSLPALPYDPAQAQARLEEAGWRDADGDGLREAHGVVGFNDGTPLRLKLVTTTNRESLAAALTQAVLPCGIGVDVATYPPETFYTAAESPLRQGAFDVALMSLPIGLLPPCEAFLPPNTAFSGHAGNPWGFADAEFSAACLEARATLPGQADYEERYQRVVELFAQRLPALPLYLTPRYVLARSTLQGIPETLIGQEETVSVAQWKK